MKAIIMKRPLAFLTVIAFAFSLLPSLTGLENANAQTPPPLDWQSKLNTDHPLVGKIYSVEEGLNITPNELIVRLAAEHHVLLGEIHDNADHHRLQAWIISQMVSMNRKPAIVMEQIRADQAGLLKLFMSGKHKTAKRMGPAINWKASGWPEWQLYQPIAEAALRAGLSIYAGDTTKDINRMISKQGFKVLAKGEKKELGLHMPLGRALDEALLEELVGSHCNMMPKKMMGPMALVQRHRDGHLARAMRQADKQDGSILIAGNGHVRTDRAVPWYLRGEQLASKTLMIVEAQKDAQTALDHIRHSPSGKPTADYIWVTPGAEREDPCEKLRKQFGGKRGKNGKGEHGKKVE